MVAAGEAGERSLFSVDAPNVVMETVKPAEDGSGDLVLRLYESKRTATRCALTTSLPFRSAAQTNMLEETEAGLSCDEGPVPAAVTSHLQYIDRSTPSKETFNA